MLSFVILDVKTPEIPSTAAVQCCMMHTTELLSIHTYFVRFNGAYTPGDRRHLITSAMLIGPSYVVQFELVIGCPLSSVTSSNTTNDAPLALEYSTDHGMTWSLVRTGCWPPRTCTEYHLPSVYTADEFRRGWQRITVVLPPTTWSVGCCCRVQQ